MALERIAKYNGCCMRIRREKVIEPEPAAKENLTPVKPERKSRVSSVDLKKPKTLEVTTQDEVMKLLNTPDSNQQKEQCMRIKEPKYFYFNRIINFVILLDRNN